MTETFFFESLYSIDKAGKASHFLIQEGYIPLPLESFFGSFFGLGVC